jgi:Thioredoxin like C-terminal domain
MGPRERGTSVAFRLSIDGESRHAAFGTDADDEGAGTLDEQRMYQLVRQQGPIVDRTFEIEFMAPGAEGFAFTFG